MGLAIVLILLVVGTVLFHILSPWWFTPLSSNWSMIDDTVEITVWVTGIVFVAVNLFMAFAIVRYRHRKKTRSAYEPENKKLELWLTVLTTAGIVAMLAPGLFAWRKIISPPADAMVVEVVGQQWQWSYRFPGEDGVFGATAAENFSRGNPFGMNPGDADGKDDVLVAGNVLHLPVNRPIKVILRSKDVLHNFSVPQFRVKMDMVPGMVTHFWFEPTREGTFDVLCQELCGIGHYLMRGNVVVEKARSFEDWLGNQPTYRQTLVTAARDIEAGKQLYKLCATCHGQEGGGNRQLHAPKLAGLPEEYVSRQLQNFRRGIRGGSPEDVFGRQMAAMANSLPDDKAVADVSSYIESLDEKPSTETVNGDAGEGERIFRNCAACHGERGQGIWSTLAPPLANRDDWYLVSQLENFRSGVRGKHPDDKVGRQMLAMAAFLEDRSAINNVVAYINRLGDIPAGKTKRQAGGK